MNFEEFLIYLAVTSIIIIMLVYKLLSNYITKNKGKTIRTKPFWMFVFIWLFGAWPAMIFGAYFALEGIGKRIIKGG